MNLMIDLNKGNLVDTWLEQQALQSGLSWYMPAFQLPPNIVATSNVLGE